MGHCSSGKHRLAADSHWTVGLYNVTIHTVVEDTWYSEKSTLALLNFKNIKNGIDIDLLYLYFNV